MMRKFPKLLAVVLAIAIIICPAMCLSSMAATANTYSISYADDAITVNVSAETGLLVALLRLDVLGYTVDEDNIEVVTDPAIDFSANPDYDAEAGTLSLLLAAKEATDVSLVNSATVTVPVAKDDAAAIQYIALNEVQAADAGTAEAPESFLAFEGVGEDGIIETPVIADCSHIDEDADNLCDACGEELKAACEHVWEYVTATPAEGTTTAAGLANSTTTKVGSITLKCATCSEETTEDVQYYGRAKCFTAAALYESAIVLEFAGRKDRLAELGDYTNGFVRFEHVLPSGTSLENSASIIDAESGNRNGRDSKLFGYSVKAFQLTETINTVAFVEVDGVWYSGETYGYSVRSYADTVLPYTTVTDAERTLIVNMLRYGSRMQTYKGYNTEYLADADLPAEYAAMITETDPVIEGTYSKNDAIGNDCLQVLTSFTLFMDSRTEARFRVRSDRFTAEPGKSDFVIEANWTSARNSLALSETYVNEAIAGEDDEVYTQDSQSANAGRWEFYFAGCAAYDFRQVVTFKIYDPADPNTDLSNGFSASFEQLISAGITNGTYKGTELDMYKAMMNYSDAARAYFCN